MQPTLSSYPFLLKPPIVRRSHLLPAGQTSQPTSQTADQIQQQSLGDVHLSTFQILLSTAGMGFAAFHGYRRNRSVGWAIGWGILGAIFPIITNVIALAEGYAQPAPGLRSAR